MAASGSIFGGGSAGGPAGAAVSAGTQYGQNFDQGLWGLFHSLFNKNEDPYKKGFEATQPYFNQAVGQQNPFAKQGEQAIGANQDWLNTMKDPQEFIKHIMGQYQESPWAQNQQNASMRAGTNAASASGLTGSTPFAQQMQQNANNISSEDQNKWVQNTLGVNQQYGQGLNNQINSGQHATDILSQLFGNQGNMAGGAAYGTQDYKNQGENSTWSNIAKMFGG